MAIKDFLYRFRPAQLYIVLALSICYFSLQMILSHITHGLTILMSSYHMLCNIFALTGCILTIKHSKRTNSDEIDCGLSINYSRRLSNDGNKFTCINLSAEEQSLRNIECREQKLKNTFGWARIDVLTMLVVCIILASLSFSLLVEALQTLVHIGHQDSMHLPISVMILGFVGLILNGICYLLIGGYTRHQSSFLHMTHSGDVVLDNGISTNANKPARAVHNISTPEVVERPDIDTAGTQPNKQTLTEMFRDVSSTIFVIVCAFIIYMSNDEHTAKFIDPILSIFSCIVLVSLSFPYMKESCLILLQTIPGSIDMDIFEKTLGSKFPEIISYHDLHIWQLTANKYVSTVHIKFQSQKLYMKIIADVRSFFYDQGITIVTIQPEFQDTKSAASLECLVQCNGIECAEKVCCQQSRTDLRNISVTSLNNGLQQRGNFAETIEELKISSLLKSNAVMERSQSVNNVKSASVGQQSTDLTNSVCELKCPSEDGNQSMRTAAASSTPDI